MFAPLRRLGLCLLLPSLAPAWGGGADAAAPVCGIVFPSAEQVAVVPEELKARLAAAMKSVCLHHTIRMVQEEHRYTSANHLDAADRAKRLGAPPLMERALRLLADEDLPGPDRSALYRGVDGLYSQFGVDAFEIRFFVETSGIPVDFLPEVADWLPMEPLFNLPPDVTPGKAALEGQAATLGRLYPAIREQLASAQDAASAEAAAEVLKGMLMTYASTQALRSAPEESQRNAFAVSWQYANSIIKEIHALRTSLQENEYHGSAKLRAVDYLLR